VNPSRSAQRKTRGTKRKPSEEADVELDDIEMEDISSSVASSSMKKNKIMTEGSSKKSPSAETTQVFTSTSPTVLSTKKVDKATHAVVTTVNSVTSPFRLNPHVSIQTENEYVYDQEYIDFLIKSHQEMIASKDHTIAIRDMEIKDLRRRLAITERQLEQSRTELQKEMEKKLLEKGWKKHF
jgi:uncharacterized protein involved in exopolysaccharide biosynthesis